MRQRFISAQVLTLLYAAFASLWILVSDGWVAFTHGGMGEVAWINIGKGLVFVAVTSVLLHLLASMMVRRVRQQADETRAALEREAAVQLERTNRLNASLARASAAAVGASSRAQLCGEICQALVDCVGLRLVLIGWVDEQTRFLRIESQAGPAGTYTDDLVVSADPAHPESRGPTGRALIGRVTTVCLDVEQDEMMAPFLARARAHGVKSVLAVPVRDSAGARGTLTLLSGEKGFFIPEVVRLVERLASDLSHGLEVLASRRTLERQTEALRESERRFRELFISNPHPMWVYDIETLRFLAVNTAAVTHYGYSEEEFLALTLRDIRPEGEIKRFEEYSSGQKSGSNQAGIWVHRRKNGEVFEVEVSLHSLDFAGRKARLVLAVDVSARMAAERATRESEQRHRSLFEDNHAVMLIMDPESHRIVDANAAAAEFYGWSREELRGMPVARLNVLTHEEIGEAMRQAAAEERHHFEFRHRTADGTVRSVEVFSGPVRLGERSLLYSIVHDVSARHRAETALRESENINRITFEEAPVGIAHLSIEGHWLRVNRRLCEILGRTERELVGRPGTEVTPVEDVERDYRVMRRLLEGLVSSTVFEKRFLRRDGSAVPTNVTISLVRRSNGQPHHFIAIIEDISERKVAELSLRESDARLKLALQVSGQGIWDLDVKTGRAVVSAEYVEMLGYDQANFTETYESWIERTHPDDRAELQRVFDDYMAGRRGDYRLEVRQQTKDGQWRWVLTVGQVVERDADGNPLRMLGTLTDITDRRRANERMELLYTALQAVPAGIVITDHTGSIEWVNEAFTRLTGYSRIEAMGVNPRILRSGRQSDKFYHEMWEVINRGEVWSGELFNRRKDGSEYEEQMIIAPVKYRGSAISHFIAIKQDVTEAKRMEHQLLRSQRLEGIGLLAGGIAHDLNNVLAPILLTVELMRMRLTSPADRRALEVIESAARRGSGVVKQVLTFARGIDGERSVLRPRDLVREIVMIVGETFPRHITVSRETPVDTPPISGDQTQLHQVLLNFAVNARDAMPSGGTLTFRLGLMTRNAGHNELFGDVKAGTYVVISVIDTGEGMSPVVRERIFDPFFTTKPHGKGTGLGLSTALGIVRSHGGFIEVDSTPGAGSEFRVFLPALPWEADEAAAATEFPRIEGAGRTVLVCDDEAPIREMSAIVLRQFGFEVLEASNGREAIEVFEANRSRISAIVIDIMMPQLTGDRAAAEILRQQPDLPVIFMSGLMEQDAVQSALGGFGDQRVVLIRKPFVASELLAQLARALARRSAST